MYYLRDMVKRGPDVLVQNHIIYRDVPMIRVASLSLTSKLTNPISSTVTDDVPAELVA